MKISNQISLCLGLHLAEWHPHKLAPKIPINRQHMNKRNTIYDYAYIYMTQMPST